MTTLIWLIGSVVVGVIAAWLAGRLMKGNGFGLLGDSIAGALGAIVGGYVLGIAGMNLGGLAGRLVVSFIAAAIVLFLVHAFTSRRDGHRSWS